MNNKRTQALMIREVTGQLPQLPDEWFTENAKIPHAYATGRWFYIELHIGNFGLFGPAALGIVNVTDDGERAEMVSMHVEDCVRREGYGRQIIEAAGERWPMLTWTDTGSSRPFHQHLIKEGIARRHRDGSAYYDFIPKAKRKVKP